MLGETISDPYQVEAGGSMKGMELLPVATELKKEKTRTQVTGSFGKLDGVLSELSGKKIHGYEIHMGSTVRNEEKYLCKISDEVTENEAKPDGIFSGNVYGTYVHGIFDEGTVAQTMLHSLAEKKGIMLDTSALMNYEQFKQMQYDKLADGLRKSMDMEAVYAMLREAAF